MKIFVIAVLCLALMNGRASAHTVFAPEGKTVVPTENRKGRTQSDASRVDFVAWDAEIFFREYGKGGWHLHGVRHFNYD